MNAIALLAALCIGQVWGPFQQGPPAWGTPGAGSSPACNPPIDAKAFYDSINGDRLAAAVVRVSVQDRNGQTSLGSGTLVEAYSDGSGLVVTNNHVIADAASATSGSVFFRGGRQSRFTIRDADATWDIAILEVEAPAEVEPVTVSDQPPQRGEPLMIGGYGGDNRLLFQAGSLAKRLAPRIGQPFEQFELQPCQARQGDSGGPVFNGKGRLCGALWGASPGTTVCTPGGRILALLRAVRARLGRILRGGNRPGNGGGLQPIPQRPAPVLPGPFAQSPNQSPNQSPASPPAQPAPPQNDSNGSGPAAGGELAKILDRLKDLEGKIASSAGPAIESEGGRLAEGAIESAAPSLFAGLADNLLPLILKTLGITLGGATGLGGAGLAGWGAFKLLRGLGGMLGGVLARRRTARTAAKMAAQQGSNGGRPDATGTDAHVFISPAASSPAFDPQAIIASEMQRLAKTLKTDLQSTLDAKLSIIDQHAKATAEIVAAKPDPAPQFVPTQVDNPQLIALEKALETFGGQTPANAKWVNLIYSFRDQLLNRAKAA